VTVSPNQTTQVSDSVTVTSLSASIQHKTSATTFNLCQIALGRKLSRIVYAGSRQTENYRANLKSGVNF